VTYADFQVALERLRDWHSDSVKAQNFTGPQITPTKPGATVLRAQPYPHESYWRNRWRLAKGAAQRREVVEEMEQEYTNLQVSPSKKHVHFLNTLEWKVAIAKEEGSSEHVGRLWAVSSSTVRKYRKLHG
jgi:hypothetical protein